MFNRILLAVASEQTVRAKVLLERWPRNGRLPEMVEAGILVPSEMHARLKALLERMAKDLNARLDPVSAIL
jgi:hypothetical protein